MGRRLLSVLVLLATTSGCFRSYVNVTSDPPGAEIIRDGARTGKTTPARLKPFTGLMTVQLEGYETPQPYSVQHHVAGERIAVTIIVWPVGAILWGFQFVKAEQKQYHFDLKPQQ